MTSFPDYTASEVPFRVGDVVHGDGSCAILGDVVEVAASEDAGEQLVTVIWRRTQTTEYAGELYIKERSE